MTDAMVRSGDVVDLSAIPGVKVDKHSTGGVADTTTLVLAPLVAACGVPVAKMSGRGLGHTGGTLDKLESIPGLSRRAVGRRSSSRRSRRIGVAVIAQSPDIDPADKKIYALRDVTGTVPSIPLIVGSIISKKIAGGADAIVLDVKVGSGAFMKTEAEARQLAHELTAVGRGARPSRRVRDERHGPAARHGGRQRARGRRGDRDASRDEGPAELTELCLVLGAKMLVLGERAADETQAARAARAMRSPRQRRSSASASGSTAQGGDPRVADDTVAAAALAVRARGARRRADGCVARFDAEGVGRAAMVLGAGRARVDDVIDPGAGLVLARPRGRSRGRRATLLCTMYAASEALLDAGEERFRRAVHLGDSSVSQRRRCSTSS